MQQKSLFILGALLVLILSGCSSDGHRIGELRGAEARLAQNPEDLDALIWVGRRLGYLGRYDEAIATYTRGLNTKGPDPRLLRHRGHRFLSLRRFAMAEKDLSEAATLIRGRMDVIEQDGLPNQAGIPTSTLHTNIYYHLGLAYFLQRKWMESAGAFEEAAARSIRDDMRIASLNWAALSHARNGRPDIGVARLRAGIGKPHIIENESYLSLCLMQMGDLSVDVLQGSLGNGLDLATAGFGVSAYLQRLGDHAAREALLNRILLETPPSAFGHLAAEVDRQYLDKEDLPPGSAIIMAGERFPVAAPVRTFRDGSFNAECETCWFTREQVLPKRPARGCDTPSRLGTRGILDAARAERVATQGWSVDDARAQIDQFVLHYDVCVTSTRCFEVLHDLRGLSVHFMLDVDGTIYQTCDMVARARHASQANDRSIGVEIAHIGAYGHGNRSWQKYYRERDDGRFDLVIPARLFPPDGGPFSTSRTGLFEGEINKRPLVQVDYTEPQYRSLTALMDALSMVLPRLTRGMPMDQSGSLLKRPFTPEELRSYRGVLGHHHVTSGKQDPGPALDWQRILRLKE